MSSMRELHDQAMRMAQMALAAREKGDNKTAEAFAAEAVRYESQAADLVPLDNASEPTRSILYRSAASLAYQARQFDASIQLIAKALAGYPPSHLKDELKALWQQVTFEEHLEARGVVLATEDLQMSLEGSVVGSGMIYYDEFMRRIQALYSILSRTVQRKLKRAYQRSGRPGGMYSYFTPALSVPRSGSFAITVRLVMPSEYQTTMLFNPSEVISEVLAGVDLVDRGDQQAVKTLISEDAYYTNFISQVKRMAPDGENITLVGLTSGVKQVGLTRIRQEIAAIPGARSAEESSAQSVTLEGMLNYARSRGTDVVGLTTDDGKNWYVDVREGMDDLVKSYFDQRVSIKGSYDAHSRRIHLTDIEGTDR